tara:strand:- start:135 stop:455 length:321 start_codon:yes stop_codon:yes gene_type:complete
MSEKIFIDFEPNDFIVRITPLLDENNAWTGELKIGSITTDDNTLSDDDYSHLMYLVTLLSSAVPLMEEDSEFRNKLNAYAQDSLKPISNKPTIESVKDNVVKLKFH